MTRRVLAVVAVLLLAHAAPARAESDKWKEGRAHAKQAKAYLEAKDYDRAVAEYQAAYDLDGKSTRLYNIGVVYDQEGDRDRAIVAYQRYLAADPNGEAAETARAAIVALTAERDAELQRQRDAAQEQQREADAQKQREADAIEARRKAEAADAAKQAQDRQAAEEHVKQAKAYVAAGSPSQAGDEYLAAYATQPDPELLWSAAEAYRAGGAKPRAVEQYRRYLGAASSGPHADDARMRIAVLTKPDLDSHAAAARVVKQSVRPLIIDDRPPPRPAPKWLFPALSAVSLGAGLLTDLAPSSAHNGRFDALDVVPVGCYALSAIFLGVWVF